MAVSFSMRPPRITSVRSMRRSAARVACRGQSTDSTRVLRRRAANGAGESARLAGAGRVGDSFWLGRIETGPPVPGFRPVVFYDIGWAGARGEFTHRARHCKASGWVCRCSTACCGSTRRGGCGRSAVGGSASTSARGSDTGRCARRASPSRRSFSWRCKRIGSSHGPRAWRPTNRAANKGCRLFALNPPGVAIIKRRLQPVARSALKTEILMKLRRIGMAAAILSTLGFSCHVYNEPHYEGTGMSNPPGGSGGPPAPIVAAPPAASAPAAPSATTTPPPAASKAAAKKP